MKPKKSSKPYRTKPRPLGLRPGLSYDKVSELLARDDKDVHAGIPGVSASITVKPNDKTRE